MTQSTSLSKRLFETGKDIRRYISRGYSRKRDWIQIWIWIYNDDLVS